MVIHTHHGVITAKSWRAQHDMAWWSQKKAWSCYGDHGHYYNIVRTLIIQPTLLIIYQLVVRYFYNAEYVERTHQRLPERRLTKMNLFLKNWKFPKITKSNIYIILKLFWNSILLTCHHRRKLNFWRKFRPTGLTRQFGGKSYSNASQLCHIIMVCGSHYLRKHWEAIHFFTNRKHGKHDDHTMIMVKIMENMVIMPWSW